MGSIFIVLIGSEMKRLNKKRTGKGKEKSMSEIKTVPRLIGVGSVSKKLDRSKEKSEFKL